MGVTEAPVSLSGPVTVAGAVVRRLALASVVANVGIAVTGGAVRLTASGLGCPTVPYCTGRSLVPTAELGIHGVVEFTNRMLTFAITAIAIATLVAVLRSHRRDLVRLAAVLLAGIPVQAVLGAITVLTGLNPYSVMGHFLLSMGLVATAVVLWQRSGEPVGPAHPVVPLAMVLLGRGLLGVVAATLTLGTIVTGTGPHAGDPDSPRMGFDLAVVSQLHADAVLLLIGMTIALYAGLVAIGAPAVTRRAGLVLLVVELSQGLIGYVQYFTNLPVVLVGFHLLGAGLVNVFVVRLYLSMRRVPPAEVSATVGSPVAAA